MNSLTNRNALKSCLVAFLLFILLIVSLVIFMVILPTPMAIGIPLCFVQLGIVILGLKTYRKRQTAGKFSPILLIFSGAHILFLLLNFMVVVLISARYEDKGDTAALVEGFDKFLSGKGMHLPEWMKKSASQNTKTPVGAAPEEKKNTPAIKMTIEDDNSKPGSNSEPSQKNPQSDKREKAVNDGGST